MTKTIVLLTEELLQDVANKAQIMTYGCVGDLEPYKNALTDIVQLNNKEEIIRNLDLAAAALVDLLEPYSTNYTRIPCAELKTDRYSEKPHYVFHLEYSWPFADAPFTALKDFCHNFMANKALMEYLRIAAKPFVGHVEDSVGILEENILRAKVSGKPTIMRPPHEF